MAQHGYLGDGYGSRGDQGEERFGREDRWQENGQRERQDRGMMFRGRTERWSGGDREQDSRFGGDEHAPYLSWRERQIRQFDEEYADYCREREQQFHQDFESWRRSRRPGTTSGPEEELLLAAGREDPRVAAQDQATDAATLGQADVAGSGRRDR